MADWARRLSFSGSLPSILEAAGAHMLLGALGALPYRVALTCAEWVGLACGTVSGRWRCVADRNLRRALPELGAEDRLDLTRDVFRNLGRVVFALAQCPRWTEEQVRDRVQFRGLKHYREAASMDKGVLLLTAHLGNWELGALAHGAAVGPLHVMVRPIRNEAVDRLVERLRSSHGNTVIPKRHAARRVLRVLRQRGTVGILADQNVVHEEAVFVRFFGRATSAAKGFAQIALRSGAPVVPATAWWDARAGRHVVEYGAAIRLLRTGDAERDVQVNTQRFQSALEERIRQHPGQWLWIHRRWRTQPADDSAREPASG